VIVGVTLAAATAVVGARAANTVPVVPPATATLTAARYAPSTGRGEGLRPKLGFIHIGAVVALALLATGVMATYGLGKTAAACSNETINEAKYLGKVTYRFVLKGNVSCNEAHRTLRAYIRAVAAGRCPSRICTEVVFAGGWTCSATSAAEQQTNGGLLAGCDRRRASFVVYRASHADAVVFSPLAYGISCHMTDDGSSAGSWVYCWIGGSSDPTRHVKLRLDGQFSLVARTPIPLGLGGPALGYGKSADVGRFRCQSLRTGMSCTVISTGRGVLFNSAGARRVAHS
jgi:hypothetical protein